jgi:hypothetical protein
MMTIISYSNGYVTTSFHPVSLVGIMSFFQKLYTLILNPRSIYIHWFYVMYQEIEVCEGKNRTI